MPPRSLLTRFATCLLAAAANAPGLLEDISIWSQLAVSRLFGAVRWLLQLLSLQRLTAPPAPQQPAAHTPAATSAAPGSQQQQQQQQQQWAATPELQVLRQQMHKSHTQGTLQVRLAAGSLQAGCRVSG
jgi:hypothetical protein